MGKTYCRQCIHQHSWIRLARLLLRSTVTLQELDALGFTFNPSYDKTSKEIFRSSESWQIMSDFLDQKLKIDGMYERYTIFQLLEVWGRECKNGSKETVITLLWTLLRRREECPYRICSKVLHQLEDLTLLNFFKSREAS